MNALMRILKKNTKSLPIKDVEAYVIWPQIDHEYWPVKEFK